MLSSTIIETIPLSNAWLKGRSFILIIPLAMRILALLFALSLTLTACGSMKGTGQKGVSSNEIVVTELSDPIGGLTAYEIVKRYNANWLEKRGPMSFQGPVEIKVYVDNTGYAYGNASSLRQIQASRIESIKYYSGREAQSRFGLGNVAGALLVRTRSGG